LSIEQHLEAGKDYSPCPIMQAVKPGLQKIQPAVKDRL
jgi:hypothetical protein